MLMFTFLSESWKMKMFTKPGYCSSMLSELLHDSDSCDTVITSDNERVSVHIVILSSCSQLLRDILTTTGSKTIILPGGFSSVFSYFKTMIYTGSVVCYTEEECELLLLLCTQLGMDTTVDYSLPTSDKIVVSKRFQDSDCMKVKTEIICDNSGEKFVLRFPKSRINRKNVPQKIISKTFEGFRGRIQDVYNCSPVGQFEGPFDQNPLVPLTAQLAKSKLSYENYVQFRHSQTSQCKILKVSENYENTTDLQKIDSIEIVGETNIAFEKQNNDEKVTYTCSKNSCIIPCLCHICNSQDGQCPRHNMRHMDLFDEKEDAISVRSTDHFCCKETFFSHSYTLKYPGIPKKCIQCCKDLLHHICYHLDFHNSCKFCKLYQFKLFPQTDRELHKRKIKEKAWYKSVCPYCDKKFCEPYTVKKHIELQHTSKNLKCVKCPKAFQSKQSLDYHILTKHTQIAPPPHVCNICEKNFQTKLGLNNHIKFKHANSEKLFSCEECESKFKHKKYLKAHMLHVHDSDEKKEDYWQDLPKINFECETCRVRFVRKADLKAHIKSKHTDQDMLNCDQCSAQFTYLKSLNRHKLEKHGPEQTKSTCPDCGKMFNQRRNMERHMWLHKKN